MMQQEELEVSVWPDCTHEEVPMLAEDLGDEPNIDSQDEVEECKGKSETEDDMRIPMKG